MSSIRFQERRCRDAALSATESIVNGCVCRYLKDVVSRRVVRPLACFFWGEVWTLAAWCEQREDFRSFRVDRIRTLDVLDARFRDEPGRTLADLFRSYDCDSAS